MVNEWDKADNEAASEADTLSSQSRTEMGLLILFICRKESLWGWNPGSAKVGEILRSTGSGFPHCIALLFLCGVQLFFYFSILHPAWSLLPSGKILHSEQDIKKRAAMSAWMLAVFCRTRHVYSPFQQHLRNNYPLIKLAAHPLSLLGLGTVW